MIKKVSDRRHASREDFPFENSVHCWRFGLRLRMIPNSTAVKSDLRYNLRCLQLTWKRQLQT